MRQFRYLLVASDGTSHDFARHDHFEGDTFDLPELLADGWRPVRETAMGEGTWLVDGKPVTYALALILLEKKVSEPKKSDSKKGDSKKGEGKKNADG
jgi:hypothetical protein